jgi:MFS family permease
VLFLAISGAADMVSAAYRSTMLQVAAPDQMRGRLQGVFIVVVAGGPRAGDFLAGSVAGSVGERLALVLGGLGCLVGVVTASALSRRFLEYDARHPTPGRADVAGVTGFVGRMHGCNTQTTGILTGSTAKRTRGS